MTTRIDAINMAMLRISHAQRGTAEEWVRGTDLTVAQSRTLGFIEATQDRGVIARELSQVSGTTAASVASLLQGLEERGLVTRRPSPTDSRQKLLYVTDAGAALVQGWEDDMRAAQQQLWGALSAGEQDQLLALLEKVADATPELPQRPPAPRGAR